VLKVSNAFFDHPILHSPYDYPARHWELDETGQPTQQIIERRRRAEFITPDPEAKETEDGCCTFGRYSSYLSKVNL